MLCLPSTCLSGFILKHLRQCREPFGSAKQQDGSEPASQEKICPDILVHLHIQGWEGHLVAEVGERALRGTDLPK